jgi:hypothetical protein
MSAFKKDQQIMTCALRVRGRIRQTNNQKQKQTHTPETKTKQATEKQQNSILEYALTPIS